MTNKFSSKEEALRMGIFYAGGSKDTKIEDLKKVEGSTVCQFDDDLEAEVYEIETNSGKKARIATARFRDGYDLWLISPEGFAVRV
jgi:ribosomal protein L2